ncbi:hypothetical protein LTR28_011458, partial [Elasticomyces elasticus]
VPGSRRTRFSNFVANSSGDDEEADDAIESDEHEEVVTRKRRMLQEVAIPATDQFKRPLLPNKTVAPSSVSSISPLNTTPRDTSSEYETPGTSTIVTPPLSIYGKSTTTTRKRSRLSFEEHDENTADVDGDAALASALQEEEWTVEPATAKRAKTAAVSRRQRGYVAQSNEDDSVQEIAESDFSDSDRHSTIVNHADDDDDEEVASRKAWKAIADNARASMRDSDALSLSSNDSEEDLVDKDRVLKSDKKDSDDDLPLARIPSRAILVGSDVSSMTESVIFSSSDDDFHVAGGTGDFYVTGGTNGQLPLARVRSRAIVVDSDASSLSDSVIFSSSDSPDDLHVTGVTNGQPRRSGYARTPGVLDPNDFNRIRFNRRKERERKKLEKAHPAIVTMWDTLEKIEPIRREEAEQPDCITRKLKSFQLEGLNWMIKQEKTHYKGGLLGDEMGM